MGADDDGGVGKRVGVVKVFGKYLRYEESVNEAIDIVVGVIM
jgi:hypothetical protein